MAALIVLLESVSSQKLIGSAYTRTAFLVHVHCPEHLALHHLPHVSIRDHAHSR